MNETYCMELKITNGADEEEFEIKFHNLSSANMKILFDAMMTAAANVLPAN